MIINIQTIAVPSLTHFKVSLKDTYYTVDQGVGPTTLYVNFKAGATSIQVQSSSLTDFEEDYEFIYSTSTGITQVVIYTNSDPLNGSVTVYSGGADIGTPGLLTYEMVYWIGYVQPDNFTRPFYRGKYEINLSATDGLQELENIPFPQASATGQTSLIRVVRMCLDQVGIPLQIHCQSNVFENNLMVSGDSVFSSATFDTRRLLETDDGRVTSVNCLDTLKTMLTILDCFICQSGGVYWIQSNSEHSNFVTRFYYDSLGAKRFYSTRVLDISNYKILLDSAELSKVPPLKKVEISFRNRYESTTQIFENPFFNENINGWTQFETYPFTTFEWDSGDYDSGFLSTKVDPPITSGHTNPAIFYSDPFTLTKEGEEDYVSIQMQAFTFNLRYSDTFFDLPVSPQYANPPIIEFILVSASATQRINVGNIQGNSFYYVSANHFGFRIVESGEYYLIVQITPNPDYNVRYDFEIYSILGFTKYESDDTTRDHFYQGEIASGITNNNYTAEVLIADGASITDIGNLKIDDELTSSWSTDNGAGNEELSIQNLLIKQRLVSSKRYKDYVRLTLKDRSTVFVNSLLQINGIKYSIASYNHDLINNKVELELQEFLTDPVNIVFTDSELSTIEGQ